MPKPFPDELMASLSDWVACRLGLHFPPGRWRDLERGIRSAAGPLGFSEAESGAARLVSSELGKSHIEILASFLTVGETYFFRQPATFEVLEQRILPELIRRRKRGRSKLRIWSAGCATGEEPYSIAILLDRLMAGKEESEAVILATDVNPRFLRIAARGVYGPWSFRGAPKGLQSAYFERLEKNKFRLRASIRKKVTFSYLNLAEDCYPALLNNTHGMDVIFCRNVLMYFAPAQAAQVVGKLYRALAGQGWLAVSPCEASVAPFSEFTAQHFGDEILYQKNGEPGGPRMEWKEVPAPIPADLPPAAMFSLPAIRADDSRPPAALTEPRQSIASSPSCIPSAPCEAARTLYESGCYAQAIELLETGCPEPSGRTAEECALLSHACANLGRLAEALAHCDHAIAKDKLHAGNYYLRAVILMEQGALGEARQALKKALYLDPGLVPAHLALANLACQQGEGKDFSRHFGAARRLLSAYGPAEIVPGSEGMTAGQLKEILDAQQTPPPGRSRQSSPRPKPGVSAHTRTGQRKRSPR